MKTPPKIPTNIVYGARAVMEAIDAGQNLEKVFIHKALNSELRKDVLDKAVAAGIPFQAVPVEKIDRMVRGVNHQGVVARMALIKYVDLEEVLESVQEKGETPLVVVLDQVSDVRNFGAIARTAECMGAHALVVPQQGAAQINGDAIKISAGALHHLPVARVKHLKDLIFLVSSYGLQVVSCTEKAEQSLFEVDFSKPSCLIFGSEEKGISKGILRASNEQARIPMQGQIASLNVSVSVGMALLEVSRQRS